MFLTELSLIAVGAELDQRAARDSPGKCFGFVGFSRLSARKKTKENEGRRSNDLARRSLKGRWREIDLTMNKPGGRVAH